MSNFRVIALFLCLISCHGIEGRGKVYSTEPRSNADEYECVDIYKQPAFDNVLLKNHKIQMAPSFAPKFKQNGQSSFNNYSNPHRKGCPEGMVPIARPKVNLKDINYLSESNNFHPLTAKHPGQHFAMVTPKLETKFFGATATIGLDNPPVKMDQISGAQIWFEDGAGAERNILHVGWAVHPRIYGDSKTRMTGYWTVDGSKTTGCYNAMCPGFVQVHPTLHLGASFGDISDPETRFSTNIFVFRDTGTGNWWLVVDNTIRVGYWPKEIFTKFDDGVELLQFGGWTVHSPDGVSPPMGKGNFPTRDTQESAFFQNLGSVTTDGVVNAIKDPEKFADNTKCYDAIYFGDLGVGVGQAFTFGGPGGTSCGV